MTTDTAKLTVTTPSEREILTERIFDAPRDLVYETFTDPELMPQWYGPRDQETVVVKMDVRAGGDWEVAMGDPGDPQGRFRGTYREVTPPERIVQTFEWMGMPGHVLVETTEFEDLGDGRTKIRTTSIFHTTEERDGMLASGMESGQNEAYDQLAELLAKRKG